MKRLNELIKTKITDLDLDREESLIAAQEVLNELYPGKVRARSLNDGLLTITTPSAAVATDVRLGQVKLLKKLKKLSITKLKINIS